MDGWEQLSCTIVIYYVESSFRRCAPIRAFVVETNAKMPSGFPLKKGILFWLVEFKRELFPKKTQKKSGIHWATGVGSPSATQRHMILGQKAVTGDCWKEPPCPII